jgi:hypothetical protein
MTIITVQRRWIPRYGRASWATVARCGKWGRRVEVWPFRSRERADTFRREILTTLRSVFGEGAAR